MPVHPATNLQRPVCEDLLQSPCPGQACQCKIISSVAANCRVPAYLFVSLPSKKHKLTYGGSQKWFLAAFGDRQR